MTVWLNKDTTSVVACTQIMRVSVLLYDEYNIVTICTAGLFTVRDALNCLHSFLEEVVKWSQSNLLKLNEQKTDVVVFGTKHKLPLIKDIRITIGGSTMSSSSQVRNLGVIFDSTLSMTTHISTICRTAYMHLHKFTTSVVSGVTLLQKPPNHLCTLSSCPGWITEMRC